VACVGQQVRGRGQFATRSGRRRRAGGSADPPRASAVLATVHRSRRCVTIECHGKRKAHLPTRPVRRGRLRGRQRAQSAMDAAHAARRSRMRSCGGGARAGESGRRSTAARTDASRNPAEQRTCPRPR